MQRCSVFYNRKPQTGSSCFSGMALIHPIKTFENSLLLFFGNSDSVIFHSKAHMVFCGTQRNLYMKSNTSLILSWMDMNQMHDRLVTLSLWWCEVRWRGREDLLQAVCPMTVLIISPVGITATVQYRRLEMDNPGFKLWSSVCHFNHSLHFFKFVSFLLSR